jgi:outer membrane protein insertion porin family/translocation and assembly module TamA
VAIAGLALLAPRGLRAQDLSCEPGDREVRAVEFEGNRTFPDRELALRINTTPSSFARRLLRVAGARRCLDPQELARDVSRLQVFYRRRGFFETKVDTSVAALRDDAVRVTFRITEGAPLLLDSVAVQGLDSITAEARYAVLGAVRLRRGQRFDQELVRATADSISARLRERGYPRADVALSTEARYAERTATVGFTVVPGQLAHLGRIEVRVEPVEGKPQQIREPVVRRIAGLREGALYREGDLAAAQRNLYGTSAFRHVEVRTAIDSLHPLGDSLRVLIDLREDLMRQVDAEAGWGTLDCFRTRAQYVDRNFLSGARRLELTAQLSKIGYGYPLDQARSLCRQSTLRQDRFSDTLHYFVGATLRQPAFRGTRFTPAFSIYRERRGEYLAYLRSTLLGGEASAEREVARATPLRLAYNIEYGRTQAEPALLCFIFSQCDLESRERISERDRPLAVASVALGRVRLDNPVTPTRGDRFRVELRSASRLIGSDNTLEFTKGWLDGAWYRPLGGGSTLAWRLRLGAVVGNSLDFGERIDFIPPQERLYAGGATSVRGFQQNELGAVVYIAEDAPKDTVLDDGTEALTLATRRVRRVVPTGGNSLIVGNLDWRLRSPFFPELLQWTLFTDVGEVWTRGQEGLGFRSLKWTPGVGMRVFTFVGPVQVNVAYNPYARPAGPIFFDAPVRIGDGFSRAPLFCVTPGNTLEVTERDENGVAIAQEEGACRSETPFRPDGTRSFWRRLTFTLSIGSDF